MPDEHEPRVAELRRRTIPATAKGFGPVAARTTTTETLGERCPALHTAGFGYPVLTLRDSALRHNIAGMARYCAAAGVELAPHGKTTMAPQIAARQLAAGAWGITTATAAQARTYRSFGVSRLLLANEVVDRAEIAWLADELAADDSFEVSCYVDSLEGVGMLDQVLREHPAGRRLAVLVELGHHNGRTGARTSAEALAVARAAAETETLRVAGTAGYEGGLGHDASPSTLDAVAAYCRNLRELTVQLREAGLCGREPIVSAGGSAFFDVVTRELTTGWPAGTAAAVVLRSGSYVTHDHGFYAGISPAARHGAGGLSLVPALELWAPVLSRPEPGLALLGAGKRDLPFDEPSRPAAGAPPRRPDDDRRGRGGGCGQRPARLPALGGELPARAG